MQLISEHVLDLLQDKYEQKAPRKRKNISWNIPFLMWTCRWTFFKDCREKFSKQPTSQCVFFFVLFFKFWPHKCFNSPHWFYLTWLPHGVVTGSCHSAQYHTWTLKESSLGSVLPSPPSVSLFASFSTPHLLSCLSAACLSLTLWSSCRLHSPRLSPQTHSSCGTSRPLLHTGLDKTRVPSWVSLQHANGRALCLSLLALPYLYSSGRHTPTLSVAQHSCKWKGSSVASLMTSSLSDKCPYTAHLSACCHLAPSVSTSKTETRTCSLTVDHVSLRVEAEPVLSPALHSAHLQNSPFTFISEIQVFM